MKYFYVSGIVAIVVLVGLYVMTGNFSYVYQAVVLSLVEVSLSFDNAAVNAVKLEEMSLEWQKLFLWVGIPIAVFGMRFLLPLVIVSYAGDIHFSQAWDLAFSNHEKFSSILTTAHVAVAGFGGAFLMLTAMTYFLDAEKDKHWLSFLEKPLTWKGFSGLNIHLAQTAIIVLAIYGICHRDDFLYGAVSGMILFVVIECLKTALSLADENMTTSLSRFGSGLALFIYLEILDASFSFDGVIAAFALSKDVIIVAVGLGIGAMFVRSMTVSLVNSGQLKEYEYLENGAFWSIFMLSVYMLAAPFFNTLNYIVALTSAGILLASVVSSVKAKTLQTT
jgi:uncharacterized protein